MIHLHGGVLVGVVVLILGDPVHWLCIYRTSRPENKPSYCWLPFFFSFASNGCSLGGQRLESEYCGAWQLKDMLFYCQCANLVSEHKLAPVPTLFGFETSFTV
jgi:hypothetical protein